MTSWERTPEFGAQYLIVCDIQQRALSCHVCRTWGSFPLSSVWLRDRQLNFSSRELKGRKGLSFDLFQRLERPSSTHKWRWQVEISVVEENKSFSIGKRDVSATNVRDSDDFFLHRVWQECSSSQTRSRQISFLHLSCRCNFDVFSFDIRSRVRRTSICSHTIDVCFLFLSETSKFILIGSQVNSTAEIFEIDPDLSHFCDTLYLVVELSRKFCSEALCTEVPWRYQFVRVCKIFKRMKKMSWTEVVPMDLETTSIACSCCTRQFALSGRFGFCGHSRLGANVQFAIWTGTSFHVSCNSRIFVLEYPCNL